MMQIVDHGSLIIVHMAKKEKDVKNSGFKKGAKVNV